MCVFVHILPRSWNCKLSTQKFYFFGHSSILSVENSAWDLGGPQFFLYEWENKEVTLIMWNWISSCRKWRGGIKIVLKAMLQTQNKREAISLTPRSGSEAPPASSSSALRSPSWETFATRRWLTCLQLRTVSQPQYLTQGFTTRRMLSQSWVKEFVIFE